jgi:outer membrane protein assembly factor BamB
VSPAVLDAFELSFRPSAIVAGDDAIWAEDHAATNRVYAIDPATGETLADVGISRPCDLVSAFGRIWVADLFGNRLVSIDPATREPVGEVTGLRRPCGLQRVDDALWMAVDDGLARVDPVTSDVSIINLPEAAFPGAGTPLWAALYDTGTLVRVDTQVRDVAATMPHPQGTMEGPAVASGFDSLWVGGSLRLYRLDATTGDVIASIPARQPTRLLVTDDAVWTTSYPLGVVERIDPATNEIVFRAKLGGNLNGITEGFGAIWVVDTRSGILYRIDQSSTVIED